MTIIYRTAPTVTKVETTGTPFLIGIKPKNIEPSGVVVFTDGTNDILPNRDECRTYGYEYDEVTGTCYAFKNNVLLTNEFQNTNNSFTGKGNTSYTGVENTRMIGDQNEAFRQSKNNLVLGYQNRVDANIQNSLMIGRKANVTADNSLVIGGNQASDVLGTRQSIRVMYGGQTTGTANVSLGMNNKSGERFTVVENSVIYFHAETIGFRTGGTGSGAVGDFYSAVERGVMVNNAGTTTMSRERDIIRVSGTTTNWRVLAEKSSTGSTLALKCRGAANQTIEWVCNVQITQLIFGELV